MGVEPKPKQWGRAQNPFEAQKTSALQRFQSQKQVLELKKNYVKNCINARRQRAVANNRNKDVDNATAEIRRAHLNKKQFDTLSGMIQQLDILENNIQMANTTKDYAQALDQGAAQLKAIIGDQTPENIICIYDEDQDIPSILEDQDIKSILEEINHMIQVATNIGIPQIPTGEIFISQPQLESDDEIEAQINALMEGI
ncbi:MAG: hypothetical protein EZS28_005334 [Streblomastix strix]|uniref:Uncharacterized protein n=1 Tax=Streblomastix strix TaxID=222440 RepID=A0A5J4WVU2_9EUKA|nr:MAG: hypothetical protein EZS28_005334 [Streblomastix strix]